MCNEAIIRAGEKLTMGSIFFRSSTDSPVISKSVHGEIQAREDGTGSPSSLMKEQVARAKPPPAESPAMAISSLE